MRIAEFFNSFTPGGAEISVLNRLEVTVPGFSSTIVSRQAPSWPAHDVRLRDVIVLQASCSGQQLHQWVKANRFDVLIAHSPREAICLLSDRALADIPIIVVAHSPKPFVSTRGMLINPFALRLLNHRAAGHIAVSQQVSRSSWCRGSRRVIVRHLGVKGTSGHAGDYSGYSIWPKTARLRAISISRLTPSKRLRVLVDSMGRIADQLRRAGFHLAVVGNGSDRFPLERRIAELALNDLVTVHGHIPSAWEFLPDADLLIISSGHEGGPLTFYEALRAGTPILTTQVGATLDFAHLRDRVCFFTGNDRRSMAQGLSMYLQSPLSRASGPPAGPGPWDAAGSERFFYQGVAELASGWAHGN